MAKAPVPLDFYAGLIRDQERQRETDPVGEALARMRTEDVRRNIVDSPAPDEAAKVNRVARETGDQHALIEDRLPDYEKAMGAQRFADVAARYSVLGKYFNDNPRAAIAAQDDHRSLGILGEAWDTLSKVPQELKVAGYTAMGMANDTLYSLSDIGSAVGYPFRAAAATAINSPIGQVLGIPAYDPDKQDAQVDAFKQSMRSSLERRTEAARPDYRGPIQEGLLRGLDSSAATLAALLTRNPRTAASTLGTTVGAQGYQDARADGVGPGDAIRYGLTQGSVETLTEVAPASSLLSSLAKRAGPGKTIAGYLAAELPGELSATFLQSLSDWQVRNPEKTYNDWVKSLPDEARQTVLGVLGGGTVTAVAAKSAQVGADLVRRADDALRARAHADVLTRFEKAATESKYRARDPEGYSEMIGEVAKQSGVEHVFVPADAVREYMQSDSYDPYSDPLEAYRDAVDEAYETGGDVVLPSDFALGTLPGTPAFKALQPDMRLSSGGMSPREAQTFEEAMADVVAEIETEMARDNAEQDAAIDAQGKLLKSVQDKLMNAGFTPYTAQQQATLIVQRIATRAARLSQQVQGNEFTTEVRQVLPPELAAARAADATDLVINALRKGRDPASQSGPSLLEWISARGGVNDTGGDLASMGLDQWHKGKPGKRKLLRKFDPTAALGGVSGAGDYGIDNTLRAAIEAGFFPELAGVENEAGASTLDTQALLDAMSAELAGVKRYAADARVDGYRAAAQELDDLLRQRGLDPDGMSDAELRDAIAQLDQAGPEDGALYQTDSQGRPLVVVHNLSIDNFRNADELGGLAAPSIAVIRADLDWSNFGEISLIGSPDLIDPKKDRAAKGFNADVYSPRQPRARYDLHGPTLKKLRADMEQAARDIGETFSSEFDNDKLSREGLSAIENSPVAKLAYLRSIGIDVKPGYDDKPVIDKRLRKFKGTDYWSIANDAAFVEALKPLFEDVVTARDGRLRDAYFDEIGEPQWRMVESYARDVARFNRPAEINRWKTREAIEKKLNANKKRPSEFRKWVQDNYAGLIAGKFFEARDSGRRREYTMDNLVREMTRTIRDGEGYNYGVGSLRSNVAKQFRSIEDMQASRDSIISDTEMDAIKSEVTDELFALADKFAPYHRSSGDFGWPDIFTLFLKDLSSGRIREWQESIFSEPVPGELLNEARDFLDKLRGLPTEYFEVKMQRAVDLSEFEAAVVPDNAPADVVARLKDLGLKVASYPAGGSRQAAIAEVAGLSKNRVFFQSPREYYQSAYHGSPHIFDRFSLDKIGTGEGAQAYGWGLYFASQKEVADSYRRQLSAPWAAKLRIDGQTDITEKAQDWKQAGEIARQISDNPMVDGMMVKGLLSEAKRRGQDGFERFLRGVVDYQTREAERLGDKYDGKLAAAKAEAALALADRVEMYDDGRLYQVEIPNDDEYLLWDKPLSEQPEKVKAAIDTALARINTSTQELAEIIFDDGDVGKLTGERIYQKMIELIPYERSKLEADLGGDAWGRTDAIASRLLHDANVAGIKYLDGGSRSAGDGSYNYVVFDDSRVSITAYEQAYADGPRGRIRFEQVPVIELFQGRNLSTLLHELGHQYLEELLFDARRPDAPEQLRKDAETVQAWFKANGYEVVDGFIPTEAHELWARGFERYLMEGKAPSSALARVFETFRGWLMSIYKKVDALRSPITPEIREVFDRLLATDEELQQQREAHALVPLFKDAAEIMTGPEFQAYQDQFNEARVDAQSEVLAKAMREVKARVTKEYRDQRAVVEADVTESVDQRPLFRALRNLKTMPVRKGWLEDNMGLDVLDLMPKRVPPLWSDKGSHPDAVAEMSGYGSGRQMIEALIGAEMAHRQAVEGGDKRTLRERTIQSEVDAIMRERYGDPLTDGTIEREALAAVNNEKQGEVLASELRILSRKTGQRPTPYRIARQWARGKVRQGVYATEASPSAIQRHARAVSKHGSEAEKAMLAGKFDEAFAAKQKQMISSALLAEAKAANDEVTAAQKRMDKIARRQTSKSVDQDYLDQAHALLEQVDLRPRSQKSIDRQGKWAEWAAAREAEGFDVVVPASFEATLGKTNWTRLPVETMLALDEAVAQIMHLGRLKQSLLDGKERREWDEIYKEAEDSAGGLKGNPPRDLMEPGFWDAIKSGAASLDGALLKMETVFDWLDGGNSNGVFNRIAFRPVADAQGREQDMLVDYYGRIKALFEAVPAEVASRWQDKVSPPFVNRETGLPERMKRHQLIAAALNVGNAGNLQRLTDGYGWNSAALLDYLNSELTAEEWQFVQGVWDTIDTLWPEIEAMERRVNGVAPEKVEATEIVTPFGTLRGGYYPAIYDTSRSYRQEENRAAGENTLFEPNAVRATTRSGSTKARAERVNAPILLDLGVINRHLGEVIHDITHREAVMQAWKFLTSERVMRAVDNALGPEIRKQFKPWVKFVANSWAMERAGNEGFGKFLTKLRANATVVGMGLRATTMMTQIAGYSNSQEAIGGKWLAEAIARSTASPVESFDFVMANSDEVRHRMDTLDRDIRNELAAMTATNPATKLGRTLLEGRKFFFHGIGYMDRVVVVPTWLAAYNKATAEGMDHDDARYAADKAVRVSQGSGAPKDMAAIQRGTGRYGEALKLMTMFYTYLSAFYQRQRTLYRDAAGEDVRRPRDFPKLASRAFWLIVLPPILTEILRAAAGADAGPDDDEWWAQWYLRKLLVNSVGPIPLVRDVFEPAWNKARGGDWFQTSISPIQRGLESIVNTAGDIGNIVRGEETKKATKNALETIGYTTGLIPGQVASAAQFLVDVAEGDADPETWSDWMEGLSTGKIKDE